MSVATAVLEYAKELINRYELGYRILGVETEAMSRKYEAEYESRQSD